jgi:isopentenyl phosphate kinase
MPAVRPLPAALTLVKLGGSLITDKAEPLTPRVETLHRLAEEIRQADNPGSLVLGHGSGSFGHVAAAEHSIHRGVEAPEQIQGVVDTQVHAHRLHRLVVDTLWKAGVQPFSVAPSSCLVATAGRAGTFEASAVLGALRLGMIPVVFGDVVMDREWGASICSTEAVFEALVEALTGAGIEVSRALWLGATDGIYGGDGATVERVDASNRAATLEVAGGSSADDVTGGMRLRLETACRLANRGIPSWIGNGLVPGRLREALSGRDVPGTNVVAENC